MTDVDDDKPVSALINVQKLKKRPIITDEGDDEDDRPVSSIIATNSQKLKLVKIQSQDTQSRSQGKAKASLVSAEISDSDDDLPIVEFVQKRIRQEKAQKAALEKKAASSSNDSKDLKATATKSDKSDKVDKYEKPAKSASTTNIDSNNPSNSGNEFYDTTNKGKLVQTFLRRWWYAYEWPVMNDLPAPPNGYEPLDGFPGVYVSTRADTLGKILDLRDQETCPCLNNMMKKTSKELQDLCVAAMSKQIEVLTELEGVNSSMIAPLRRELNEIRSIDVAKADREARKYD